MKKILFLSALLILVIINALTNDGMMFVGKDVNSTKEVGLLVFCVMLSTISYFLIQEGYREMIDSKDSGGRINPGRMFSDSYCAKWRLAYGIFLAFIGLILYVPLAMVAVSGNGFLASYIPYVLGILYLGIYVIPLVKQYRLVKEIEVLELSAKNQPDPVMEYIKKLMREKEALAAKGTG